MQKFNRWRREYLGTAADRRDTLLTVLGLIGALVWIRVLAGWMLWIS